MSRLFRKIREYDREAADVFKVADLRTDSDIKMLTREELEELFPGRENIKLIRAILYIIHKQKPVDELLKHPSESLRAADNSDQIDYLDKLKDLKTQIIGILDAHISLVEESSTNQPNQESDIYGLNGAPALSLSSGSHFTETPQEEAPWWEEEEKDKQTDNIMVEVFRFMIIFVFMMWLTT